MLGLWQQKDSHWSYQIYGMALHLFLTDLFVLAHTGYMIDMFLKGSIFKLFDALTVLFTFYSLMLKCFWFMMKTEKIQDLMEQMELLKEMSSFDEVGKRRPTLEAQLRQVFNMCCKYYAAGWLMCISGAVLPLFHNKRGLTYQTSILWDDQESEVAFWLLAVYQYLVSMYSTTIGCSVDLVLVVFMGFSSAIIDEISVEVDSIDGSDSKSLKRLQNCMDCHIKTKDFINDVSKNISFLFFVQSFMSSLILCTSIFILTSVSFFKNYFLEDFLLFLNI